MKRIEAFIDPALFSNVRAELKELGIGTFRVRSSTSIGSKPDVRLNYRGLEINEPGTHELEVTLVVTDEHLHLVLEALEPFAVEGEIIVSSVEGAFRVAPRPVTRLLANAS